MARVRIFPDEPIGTIHRQLYGHFAEHLGCCVSEGIWVGPDSSIPNIGGIRSDVVEALRRIRPPVLRWPGGCYADDYHWTDGIGPRKDRPRRVNIWWGQTIEDNQFGTHEFISLCRLIGAEPYLAGNVGSGTVREMRDWVEYCNFAGDSTLARLRGANGSPAPFDVRYWGVGNENWGCGGNFCPEDYAAEYKRYSTYLRDFHDKPLFLIACGSDGNKLEWTSRFFEKLGKYPRIHGFAAHHYSVTNAPATRFGVDEWYRWLHHVTGIETLVHDQRRLMDEFDPDRKIALVLDEWGLWHHVEPGRNPAHLFQQNTLRDALGAALALDIFNRNCDKLFMANIAQTVNVLQALILTDGPRMLLTPTYHVFDLYQHHQSAQAIRCEIESSDARYVMENERRAVTSLHGSASISKDDVLTLSIVNVNAQLPIEAEIDLRGARLGHADVARLSNDELTSHNTFGHPDTIAPTWQMIDVESTWRHVFPPASVTLFRARLM